MMHHISISEPVVTKPACAIAEIVLPQLPSNAYVMGAAVMTNPSLIEAMPRTHIKQMLNIYAKYAAQKLSGRKTVDAGLSVAGSIEERDER